MAGLKKFIDIDAMESSATPLSMDDDVRGVKVREIYDEWLHVKSKLGNPSLKRPLIINDPDNPVHFGITLKWQVMLNLSSVPPELQGKEMLEWMKSFPMFHEVSHYVICPYDGITHAKLMMQVANEWKDASDKECLFIVNYFSDIIVNNELYKMLGEEFFLPMKRWVEYTVVETYANGFNVSLEYLVFVLVHELLWKRSFTTFNYPEISRKLAVRVVDILAFSKNWYESIAKLTRVLKQVMEHDGKTGNPGFDKRVVTVTMLKKVDAGSPGNGTQCNDGNSGDKSKGTTGDKSKEKDDNKVMTGVKKGGSVSKSPFDMVFFMGDPVAEKTRGNMDEDEKRGEKEELVSIIAKTGMGFGTSSGLMRLMHITSSEDHAWRIWLRAKAKRVMEYDTVSIQKNKGGSLVPSEWEWGMPLKDWNPLISAMNFPAWPFPPFSSGNRDFRGFHGNSTVPDVRDLLLMCDSSASMGEMMVDTKVEKWTRSFATGTRVNNKFNLSSLASFSVLHAAVSKGARFAVINFSSDCITTPWMSSNERDIDKAEKTILQFIGGGTMLPVDVMKRMLNQKTYCFMLVISDSRLHNWESFMSSIDYFKRDDHEMAMIFISNDDTDVDPAIKETLKGCNVTVHVVSKPSDLYAITVREIDRIYK